MAIMTQDTRFLTGFASIAAAIGLAVAPACAAAQAAQATPEQPRTDVRSTAALEPTPEAVTLFEAPFAQPGEGLSLEAIDWETAPVTGFAAADADDDPLAAPEIEPKPEWFDDQGLRLSANRIGFKSRF